jgi:two-component system, cell cycle sensor histidine kinase and response regulator CckA
VRVTTTRMLPPLGIDVRLAADGHDGVAQFAAAAAEFRVLLLNLTMPRLENSEQAFREIRQHRPEARVVLMSGVDEQEVVERFGDSGLAGFIQKPFKLSEHRDKLQRALEQAGYFRP